uniref:Uncharacterized protein n=1 Tax=Anguilla anguilla TaxID=7936 RepID=A0A0E9PUM3_ANGAN
MRKSKLNRLSKSTFSNLSEYLCPTIHIVRYMYSGFIHFSTNQIPNLSWHSGYCTEICL